MPSILLPYILLLLASIAAGVWLFRAMGSWHTKPDEYTTVDEIPTSLVFAAFICIALLIVAGVTPLTTIGVSLLTLVTCFFGFWHLSKTRNRVLTAKDQQAREHDRRRTLLETYVPTMTYLKHLIARYNPAWFEQEKESAPPYIPIRTLILEHLKRLGRVYDWHNPLTDLDRISFPSADDSREWDTDPSADLETLCTKTLPSLLGLPPGEYSRDTYTQRVTAFAAECDAHMRRVLLADHKVFIADCDPTAGTVPLHYHTTADRFKHTYAIGKTGSGKSTLLKNLITQDMAHGNGVIVLASESDLFTSLMPYIPKERAEHLIYLDPADNKPPIIGFNPFHLEKGEDLTQKANETYVILKRALGDLGVTMDTLIQNAVYALLQSSNSGLKDLDLLLDPTNPTLRRKILTSGRVDANTRKFWERYDQSSYYQKSYEPVMNRLTSFLRPPIVDTLSTASLSFAEVLNTEPHIILLNLSKLRGIQQETIGQLLIAQIQQSLFARDDIPERHRIPYYLYIDEFQLYAAHNEESLITLFNGARKYKLGVTIAHQTTANIPAKLLSTIIGNVGTVIALQLSSDDAPYFARELQIHRRDKDSYNPEALQNLTIGRAYVRTPNEQTGILSIVPASPIVPLPLETPTPDELKTLSKDRYGLRDDESTEAAPVGTLLSDSDDLGEPLPPEPPFPDPQPPLPPEPPLPPVPEPPPRPVRRAVVRTPSPQRKRKSILPDENESIEIR